MQHISINTLAEINGGLLVDLEYLLNGGTYPDYDPTEFFPPILDPAQF